jgi:uncharacterized membrane protein
VDPYWQDWLDLLLRWLHVVAGIVWIGTSFYFVALDKHLLAPRRSEDVERGVGGETWEIHGGGFYRVEKYRVAPETLPEPLHWFKWEAYTTWLSGFALMIVLYYVDADVYLIDRSVADLSQAEAIGISIGLLALAWVVYDGLCRLFDDRPVLLGASLAVAIAAATYGVGNVFGDRATYIQIGAMLGTIMVANVFLVIIPAHWALVRAKQAGTEPDPAHGRRGKQRSVHNNYLTLPVVLAMIATHFPVAYGQERGWLILVVLMGIGAWLRLFFNLRHGGNTVWAIPATAALAVVVLAVVAEPDEGTTRAAAGSVEFSQVREIVAARCATCHSTDPSSEAFAAAPQGIVFDTPEQIAAQADAIEQQAVLSRAMPLGNVTGMTEEERDVLAAWIRSGARAR